MTTVRRRTTLTLDDMPAVHAVRAVEFALASLPGVSRLDVALGRAVVEHDGSCTDDALRAAVELAGCRVRTIAHERGTLPIAEADG